MTKHKHQDITQQENKLKATWNSGKIISSKFWYAFDFRAPNPV